MTQSPVDHSLTGALPAADWHELHAALEEIASLASKGPFRREFHEALLASAASAVSAARGCLWLVEPDGSLKRDAAWRLDPDDLQSSLPDQQTMIRAAIDAGAALVVSPGAQVDLRPAGGVSGNARPAWVNTTSAWLILSPLQSRGQTFGLLQLWRTKQDEVLPVPDCLNFLAAVGELAADFRRQEQLQDYELRARRWYAREQFATAIHHGLDLRATSYTIANEARRLLDCDRASVAVLRGGRLRVLAVSGVADIDRRSAVISHLETLGQQVLKFGDPLWYPTPDHALPPAVQADLDAYCDASSVRGLAVLPLNVAEATEPDINRHDTTKSRVAQAVGVLVVEMFHGEALTGESLRSNAARDTKQLDFVVQQSAVALANSLEYDTLPLRRLGTALRRTGWQSRAKRWPKFILTGAAICLGIAALLLVPAELRIEARGQLLPRSRRDIFAPSDGIVSDVRLSEHQPVAAGDVLVTLRRPQLDLDIQRVAGETQTARKRLAAIQAARLGPERGRSDPTERYQQLTAEEEELKEQLASLTEQDRILREEQRELVVTSPIAGQVLTWDAQQLLAARPVQRGQLLLSVGQLESDWQLELRVPDDQAGFVIAAQRDRSPQLPVEFRLATEPGQAYRGLIEKTALATQTDEAHGAWLPVTVALESGPVAGLRPGATVIAKIDCGQRSLGFVWFRDLIAFFRQRVLF